MSPLDRVVSGSPAYQGLQVLPGINDLKATLAREVSHQFYEVLSETLRAILEEDPKFDELMEQLFEQFTSSITSEIQAQESLERMESLINDLLEEVKVNSVVLLGAKAVPL